jgi:serine/threonine-protein phosphatase Stp1
MRSNLRFSASPQTHEGRVRSVNEDSLIARGDIGLWAVADGMGGHENGQWASSTVVEALAEIAATGDFEADMAGARHALGVANDRIRQEAEARGNRMGSTVVMLMADGHSLACAWVGDSRAYRLRDRKLERLTRDHTQVQDMIDRGLLKEEDAAGHPMSHVLSRAVGVEEVLRVDFVTGEVQAHDVYLLCSDGLTGLVSSEEIEAHLLASDPATAARNLLELTLSRNAPDNVTIITVACEEMTALTLPGAD